MARETPILVSVSLRLPKDLVEALDREAVALDRAAPNRSQVVRSALERQLGLNQSKDVDHNRSVSQEVAS